VARDNGYFSSEFIDALYRHNLTIVADSYKKSAESEAGQANFELLEKGGDFTVLAPQDCAFDKKDGLLDLDTLRYDQLFGSIDNGFKTPVYTYYRRDAPNGSRSGSKNTFPRKSSTGGRKRADEEKSLDKFQLTIVDQFVAPEKKRWNEKRTVLIDQPIGDGKVVDRFTFKNIIVLIIDAVLKLPKVVSDLLCLPLIRDAPNGFQEFKHALEKKGLLDLVDNKDKLTMFVPVDDSYHYDKHDLASIVENHFFFGKIVITPLFTSVCKATAQSGKELEFSYENDIHYVSCGKTRAVILRGDVIPSNGVIHIIDRPLEC
jgi:uncharacterized surface protein with fasciclin (FAS1) repeats